MTTSQRERRMMRVNRMKTRPDGTEMSDEDKAALLEIIKGPNIPPPGGGDDK